MATQVQQQVKDVITTFISEHFDIEGEGEGEEEGDTQSTAVLVNGLMEALNKQHLLDKPKAVLSQRAPAVQKETLTGIPNTYKVMTRFLGQKETDNLRKLSELIGVITLNGVGGEGKEPTKFQELVTQKPDLEFTGTILQLDEMLKEHHLNTFSRASAIRTGFTSQHVSVIAEFMTNLGADKQLTQQVVTTQGGSNKRSLKKDGTPKRQGNNKIKQYLGKKFNGKRDLNVEQHINGFYKQFNVDSPFKLGLELWKTSGDNMKTEWHQLSDVDDDTLLIHGNRLIEIHAHDIMNK